jgi:AcrR family transcriptional regulator
MFANTHLRQDMPCQKLTVFTWLLQHGSVDTPVPRRERLRQATIDEIKQTARSQLAEQGLAAVSLRGVARAMGLTPSALYRYFDGRDELIVELVADAFASLADTLAAAFAGAPAEDHAERWLAVARAYRHWAVEHATEYTLIFGPRTSEADTKTGRVVVELHRSVGVLFRCMAEAIAAGAIDPSGFAAELSPTLRDKLCRWGKDEGVTIPPEGLAGCLVAWTQLHGFLQLELFGQLPPALGDADDLFDQQMLNVLLRVGYRPPPGIPGR